MENHYGFCLRHYDEKTCGDCPTLNECLDLGKKNKNEETAKAQNRSAHAELDRIENFEPGMLLEAKSTDSYIIMLLIGIFLAIALASIFTNHYLYSIGEKLDHLPVIETPVQYDIQMNKGSSFTLIDQTKQPKRKYLPTIKKSLSSKDKRAKRAFIKKTKILKLKHSKNIK